MSTAHHRAWTEFYIFQDQERGNQRTTHHFDTLQCLFDALSIAGGLYLGIFVEKLGEDARGSPYDGDGDFVS